MSVLHLRAELLDARGVSARIAVRDDHSLTALHDGIREAFGWMDVQVSSFWFDVEPTGDDVQEDTRRMTKPKPPPRTIADLDLTVGQEIAGVCDVGHEWRVLLTVTAQAEDDGDAYPRVLERHGEAPPQDAEEEE